jgi:hypothetical protein
VRFLSWASQSLHVQYIFSFKGKGFPSPLVGSDFLERVIGSPAYPKKKGAKRWEHADACTP